MARRSRDAEAALGTHTSADNSVSAKVRFLFDQCRQPNGEKYTFNLVENLSVARVGVKITTGWLSKVTHDQIGRPSLESLKALSDFFGIDPLFWFRAIDEAALLRVTVEDGPADIQEIALRLGALPAEDRHLIRDLVGALERRREKHELV